jgi:hypothetical protein
MDEGLTWPGDPAESPEEDKYRMGFSHGLGRLAAMMAGARSLDEARRLREVPLRVAYEFRGRSDVRGPLADLVEAEVRRRLPPPLDLNPIQLSPLWETRRPSFAVTAFGFARSPSAGTRSARIASITSP